MTLSIPTLTTERLILRAPSHDDFETETAFYASEHSKFVFGPADPFQVWDKICARIGHWAARGFGLWHVDRADTGAYVGRCGLFQPHGWPEPELGWSLMPEATGQGFATEAARAARDYAYTQLGWPPLISVILPDNTASAAVAKRLGAQPEGSFPHAELGPQTYWRHPGKDTA